MYSMPNCECNEELEIDCYEDLEQDGDTVSVQIYGHCPKCNRQYKWFDFYELSSWGELTELESEEWQN